MVLSCSHARVGGRRPLAKLQGKLCLFLCGVRGPVYGHGFCLALNCGLCLGLPGLRPPPVFGTEPWGGSWICPVLQTTRRNMFSRWCRETSLSARRRKSVSGEGLCSLVGVVAVWRLELWHPVCAECLSTVSPHCPQEQCPAVCGKAGTSPQCGTSPQWHHKVSSEMQPSTSVARAALPGPVR